MLPAVAPGGTVVSTVCPLIVVVSLSPGLQPAGMVIWKLVVDAMLCQARTCERQGHERDFNAWPTAAVNRRQ